MYIATWNSKNLTTIPGFAHFISALPGCDMFLRLCNIRGLGYSSLVKIPLNYHDRNKTQKEIDAAADASAYEVIPQNIIRYIYHLHDTVYVLPPSCTLKLLFVAEEMLAWK